MHTAKKATSLTAAERRLLERCRRLVVQVDPGAEMILYGSRARGEAVAESDYDLLILIDGPASLEHEDLFRRQLYPLELETGAVLTVLLTSRRDWQSPLYTAMPFYQNIRREGISL